MLRTTLVSSRGLPAIAGVDPSGREILGIDDQSSACAPVGLTGARRRSRFARSRAMQPVIRRSEGMAFA
jgi:hypothetical protein